MQTQAVRLAVLAVLLGNGARSQSLSIAQSTAKAGAAGSFLLKLEFEPGKEPVALQWKFSFPRGVSVAATDILAGSAAEAAQKSMTCALDNNAKQPEAVIFNCVLAGGNKPISRGTIATVRYRLANNIAPGPSRIGVDNALAVSADLKQATVAVSGGVIVVQ